MRTTHPGVRGGSSSLTPRARFLYPSETYQEAYLKLLDCLHQRRGVAVLTGEAGTGKTTLLRHVLAACEADPSVRCLFFAYPCLTYGELVSFICEDLQLDGTGEGEDGQKLDTLLHCLRERAQRGETVVLLLDEAHSLPEDVLAQLPLLVGASPTAPPLQLVLCGWSPAFEEMLWRPRLAPLRQRVSVHCRLEPLTAAEIPPFIRARLAAAGYEGRNAVRPDALRLIARYSAGVPRTIVTICDKILQAAHLSGRQDLSAELVRQVARDLRLEEPEGGARLGPEGKESTTAPADARQEEDAPAGEPGQPGFRLFARRLRTPSVVRLGEIVIALLAFWLVAHTSRVAETVPPQPQVHSPSRAASGARPDAPNPARGGYVHIPVTQAVPAPPSPVSFPAHVQTAERGHALFQTLARRYPKIRPFLWGAMTERPMIALFLPEAEWVALSEAEQGSLVLYLASLIPAAKVEPDPYIDAFRTEPGYPALRAKVAHMCADCWVIGVGRPTLDGQGVLLDRVVAQGGTGWRRSDPPDRGLQASQSGSGQRTIASAAQGRPPAETPSQPGGHTPPRAPSEVEGEEQPVRSEAPAGVQEVEESHRRVVLLEDEEQEGETVHDAAGGGPALASLGPAAMAFAEDEEPEQQRASVFPLKHPPRLSSNDGRALLKGAENGDLPTVRRLLAAGVSPNEPFPGGWTPLIMAALNGHAAIVRLLLEHGADVHATNNRGMTALMYAAWNRHAEVIRLLLKHGARVDVADHDGWTALRYARDTRLRPRAKKDAAVIATLFEQAIARQ